MESVRAHTHRLFLLTFLVLLFSLGANAQTPANEKPPSIQDNSFLIEEAYNQEDGVVQHISAFTRLWQSKSWIYTFTEEFPVYGQRNQFSYTLPVMNSGGEPGLAAGIGDLALNYRRQVIGSGDTRVAFAPRFTLIAPTGSVRMQRGMGGVGFQTNLPLSVVLSKHFVTHWNAGMTIVPRAQNAQGDRAGAIGVNAGQSIIWQAHPRFNVLLETLWTRTERVVGPHMTEYEDGLFVSPGVRWAYNFENGLQIVPGLAMPIGAGPSAGEKGVLLYLSFEHPWRAFKKK
jgi:hypothetical protein